MFGLTSIQNGMLASCPPMANAVCCRLSSIIGPALHCSSEKACAPPQQETAKRVTIQTKYCVGLTHCTVRHSDVVAAVSVFTRESTDRDGSHPSVRNTDETSDPNAPSNPLNLKSPLLNVVIQRKLIRMRPYAHRIDFLLPLVFDPRAQQVFGEDVAFQQELVVGGQGVEGVFEGAGH